MNIVSRPDAASRGLKRYFTGRPCRKGHISERYVTNGCCVECLHKPVGSVIGVRVEVHQEDRGHLESYAKLLLRERGITPTFTPPDERSEDEKAYWRMVANLRKNGIPERELRTHWRSYESFTLPDGVDP